MRDLASGRFVYVERLERRRGETPWAYARRSFRREGQIRDRYEAGQFEVIIGWGTNSVEEFLESHPEYRPRRDPDEQAGG